MKVPNQELLLEGVRRNEWPLINKTRQILDNSFDKCENIILFFSIKNTDIYQGAAIVDQKEFKQVDQNWNDLWEGSF